jgi:hypothetical protein
MPNVAVALPVLGEWLYGRGNGLGTDSHVQTRPFIPPADGLHYADTRASSENVVDSDGVVLRRMKNPKSHSDDFEPQSL